MHYHVNNWLTGRNWLADVPVIDSLCKLSAPELGLFAEHGERLQEGLLTLLQSCGVAHAHLWLLREPLPGGARERFARLYGGTAIALQRQAGHSVSYLHTAAPEDRDWVRAVFECQDEGTANDAWKLALFLLSHPVPDPRFQLGPLKKDLDPARMVGLFIGFAAQRVIPGDTRAITAAAEEVGIPWMRHRLPGVHAKKDENRMHPFGGLLLGLGANSHVLDGTFCVDRCRDLLGIAANRPALLDRASAAGAPVADGSRAAGDAPRNRYRLLVADHRLIAVIADDGGEDVSAGTHPALREMAESVSRLLGTGVLVLRAAAPDVSRPLEVNGGVIFDVDVAPRLDAFLAPDSPLLAAAARALVAWLYPPGAPSRIPLVAVTGTNGKSTTCRMIARIAAAAGFRTGLACNEGVYVNGRLVLKQGAPELTGGALPVVLPDRELELAVLEMVLARLKQQGHLFDRCDVAVLTNVTREHLQIGWETSAQIAETKASLLGVARCAVINVDDPHWRLVLGKTRAGTVCFTSQRLSAGDIRALMPPERLHSEHGISRLCYCLTETVSGQEQVVILEGDKRLELLPVVCIPATFGGTARFNVDNALHASAAGYLLGIAPVHIRAALKSFAMSFEDTPGRQNVHDTGAFRVVMDYAHNADGIARVSEFANRFEVEGKRVLLLAAANDRVEEQVVEIAEAAAAARFDHYVCRSYTDQRPHGRSREETVSLLKEGLLRAGIGEERISTEPEPMKAVELALGLGEEGDLLVLTVGNYEFDPAWERITAHPGKPPGSGQTL